MRSFVIGKEHAAGADVRIPIDSFKTHWHLIGGTGKGKTTAIHTMLRGLLANPLEKSCFFIIDRLGNFSQELLLWMASRFCTPSVRNRLVFIQPSREDVVATFNPLLYESSAHAYYRIERSTEIMLRAWESQEVTQMPRLARWTYNAFAAAAQLQLTISDCCHFLHPGSPYHRPLLELLGTVDPRLMSEWQEIMSTRGQEAMRILDSSRNRLRPYFDSDILRRMFGSTQSRLDVLRMMREGRIVIVDLSPRNRLGEQLANTIGALLINEVIAQVRSLPRDVRYPTYMFLDEFQNFVGRDIESALPELRNLGLRLILSHQSFSQLERGDHDLRSIIFQAQSRMIFGVQGEDAEILAHEVASITFDARKIKDEIYSRRQLNAGHRIEELESWGDSQQRADQWSDSQSKGKSRGETMFGDPFSLHASRNRSESSGESKSESKAKGGSESYGSSHTRHQQLVPEHENFLELASRTYQGFEEQKSEWARDIRNLNTGRALLRLVNDPKLHLVDVKRSVPGFLQYDMHMIARKFPAALEVMDRLIEENFKSDYFVPAAEIDRETKLRLQNVLHSRVSTGNIIDHPADPAQEPII
ncbi:MAG TPA: type IV secretion system DNA-binding domain-containing protein [Pirellulales bacterium]|nr:type IV secretion system DNA-binding domain-containing protein [Pirellulales bacterium]